MVAASPGRTSIRFSPRTGATKYSLAIPRREGPPGGALAAASAAAAAGAPLVPTGRAERTVIAMDGSDLLNRRQPEKLLPLHSSQSVPAGTATLLTTKGSCILRLASVMRRFGP